MPQGADFLEALVHVDDKRLRALDPTLDVDAVRAHLEAVRAVCRGEPTPDRRGRDRGASVSDSSLHFAARSSSPHRCTPAPPKTSSPRSAGCSIGWSWRLLSRLPPRNGRDLCH